MSYAPLSVGVGHLKNLDALADDAQEGITQDDLDLAEAFANAEVDAAFAGTYDVSGWEAATPPMIVKVALLLGSAQVLQFKFGRSAVAASAAEKLTKDAHALIGDIVSKKTELLDGAKEVIERRASGLPLTMNLPHRGGHRSGPGRCA
jgi:hypothetical protein